MAKADSKEAHKALEKLIADLKKVNLKALKLRPSNPRNAKAVSATGSEWAATLERAAAEIPEWCDSFSIDDDPKP